MTFNLHPQITPNSKTLPLRLLPWPSWPHPCASVGAGACTQQQQPSGNWKELRTPATRHTLLPLLTLRRLRTRFFVSLPFFFTILAKESRFSYCMYRSECTACGVAKGGGGVTEHHEAYTIRPSYTAQPTTAVPGSWWGSSRARCLPHGGGSSPSHSRGSVRTPRGPSTVNA